MSLKIYRLHVNDPAEGDFFVRGFYRVGDAVEAASMDERYGIVGNEEALETLRKDRRVHVKGLMGYKGSQATVEIERIEVEGFSS